MDAATEVKKKTQFQITYNGPVLAFDYQPHKHTEQLYKEAFRKFSVPPNVQPQLALYLPNNTTEVPRSGTQADAGIQPDTTLILRPRGAGGGRS